MLIIAHDNYVICNDSLLLTVILHIIALRNIIVDRQHDSILPASYRQFADELYIMLSAFF